LFNQCGLADGLTLVAVGGYGRGQLFPYSDVDVLVLLPSNVSLERDDALRGQVERFISLCWDAGMEVGSSVRTIEECLQESAKDVTVQTSLLEARWVCGQKALFDEFQQRYAQAMDAQLDQQRDVVTSLKDNMRRLEAKISDARTKKDLYIARARSAEASQRIQEMLGQTGTGGSIAAFEKMEQRVMDLEAKSEALEELSGDPLERQFAALEGGSTTVDNELAAMKNRLAGQGGGPDSLPPSV
jgi:uncharacterized protein YeaO (DUF488 family)